MRERASIMRECFERIGYRYEFNALPDMPFEADMAFNRLADVLVAEGRLHGSRNRRTRALIDDQTDEAVLIVNLRGPHLVEQFGGEVILGDGDAVLVSGTDPSCFTHKPPGCLLGLRVPKSRLAAMLADEGRSYMRLIPFTEPVLGLLRSYVGLTWGRSVSESPALQHTMSDHVLDLIALAAGASDDAAELALRGGLRASRLQAIKRDIRQGLEDPDLSVAALAHRHSCTPRAVQRMFEEEGTTFTAYVLEQRLLRARACLSDVRKHDEKISAVAFDCGFSDVSYFNRAFRRLFGASPSDIRARARRRDHLLK